MKKPTNFRNHYTKLTFHWFLNVTGMTTKLTSFTLQILPRMWASHSCACMCVFRNAISHLANTMATVITHQKKRERGVLKKPVVELMLQMNSHNTHANSWNWNARHCISNARMLLEYLAAIAMVCSLLVALNIGTWTTCTILLCEMSLREETSGRAFTEVSSLSPLDSSARYLFTRPSVCERSFSDSLSRSVDYFLVLPFATSFSFIEISSQTSRLPTFLRLGAWSAHKFFFHYNFALFSNSCLQWCTSM